MKIDRRLTLLGVMLIVLSTIMATQYATTKVGYTYNLVHPSNADIRFVGSDNSSDGIRVLRVEGSNTSATAKVTLDLGNWASGTNKTYTAAFAIVNEEIFAVNITHVTVKNATSGANSVQNYLQIWLHSNGSLKASDDPISVFIYNNGSQNGYSSATTAWRLARGDANASTMRHQANSTVGQILTPWDGIAHVRFTHNLTGAKDKAVPIGELGRTYNNASDFVWVQISINIPHGVLRGNTTGIIEFHFKADTHYGY
ncbi:MAG: hypothetical protein QXS02_04050 [Candidatus Thermoplasmatota archaeon]